MKITFEPGDRFSCKVDEKTGNGIMLTDGTALIITKEGRVGHKVQKLEFPADAAPPISNLCYEIRLALNAVAAAYGLTQI